MTLDSAPLVTRRFFPQGVLTITDILFLQK
jgi:hypothetical protein